MGDIADAIKPQVAAALAEALGDALDCTRAWGAWSVGTMSDDDFVSVAGNPERLDEIAEAALAPMRAAIDTSQTEIASLKQSLAEAEGQIRYLEQRLREATKIIRPFAAIPPVVYSATDEKPLYAAHYWAVVGRPDKSHFTREDLARARGFLATIGDRPDQKEQHP